MADGPALFQIPRGRLIFFAVVSALVMVASLSVAIDLSRRRAQPKAESVAPTPTATTEWVEIELSAWPADTATPAPKNSR